MGGDSGEAGREPVNAEVRGGSGSWRMKMQEPKLKSVPPAQGMPGSAGEFLENSSSRIHACMCTHAHTRAHTRATLFFASLFPSFFSLRGLGRGCSRCIWCISRLPLKPENP